MKLTEFVKNIELTDKNNVSMYANSKSLEELVLPSVLSVDYLRAKYLNLIRQDKISILGVEFNFSDSIWDFSSLWLVHKKKNIYTFKFTDSGDVYFNLVILKLYMLERINKHQVIGGNNSPVLTSLKEFLVFINERNIYKIEDITLYHLQQFYSLMNITYATKVKKKYHIYMFLKFYAKLLEAKIGPDVLNFLKARNQNKINALIEANKTPLLPKDFYSKFVIAIEDSIRKGLKNKYVLGKQALLLIASQTGTRLSGLRSLNVDCLKIDLIEGYQTCKIGIPQTKKRPGHREKVRFIAANEKTIFAVNFLVKIFSNDRQVNNTKALYVGKMYKEYLVSISSLTSTLYDFCEDNVIELDLVNRTDSDRFEKNIKVRDLKNSAKLIKKYGLDLDDIISMPTSTQFRVFVATELNERGLTTFEISYYLGHDTLAFAAHYIRPKDAHSQDLTIGSKKIIDIIDNDLRILGPNGDLYTMKLKEFFNKSKQANVLELSEDFQSLYPIRAKNGGFCIKPAGRDCVYDQNSNEFLCSFRICPNHHHLFNEIHYTYQKCVEMVIIIESNKRNGYKQEYQKQVSILRAIVREELVPELLELKTQINIKGKRVLIEKYPEISPIVMNMQDVERNIELWKKYNLKY